MTAQLDVEEIRRALSTRDVLAFYQWPVKRSGNDLESKACPQRLDHSRRAFVITPRNGRWYCHACSIGGDLFTFIGMIERVDFPAVLARAAEIAGVTPSSLSDAERAERAERWRREREEEERREQAELAARNAAAVPKATAYWESLPDKHPRGVEYLLERRVAGIVQFDAVRFDPKHGGAPALALYSSKGEIRNVVARRVPELGEPKTPGLYACPSAGTLVNAVSQIDPGRDVVVTEGVIDSITARLAWPDAVVLGAHGWANLPRIVTVAAPRVHDANTRLVLVPHQDRFGFQGALEAAEIAINAGLSIRRGTLVVVKHGAKDLNDAWGSGWRP